MTLITSLYGIEIKTGAPSIGTPFLGQTHALTSVVLAAGGADIGRPVLVFRKLFSYAEIQEADVAVIHQSERVSVRFTQGESVERNVFFFMPDGVTPVSDLSDYSARMDLREYPDDPEPILTMTSADSDIFLSDTGLITWEIPGSMTKDFEAPTFGGDLFVYAPDGDSIMVCGFDFEMTLSHTRGV